MRQRTGFGFDSHTFGSSRPLVLGGVEIDHPQGLQGHSDGDAIAHALIDALLGAAAMGDIGQLFPDTDDRWKDANSMHLLGQVMGRVAAAGYRLVNVDVTVVTQEPKLAPHIHQMRERLADTLRTTVGAVSVKAKTNEGMDAVGRGEGLTVYAVASIGDV